MSRYIDADELKDAMLFGMCGTGYQTEALMLIEEVPTADVVEVVRCKDCIYRHLNKRNGRLTCNHRMLGIVKPTDYCSYGEREGDD